MDTENLRLVVGKKQILRLAKDNELTEIQIATDADANYVEEIMSVARPHNVKVVFQGTKQEIANNHGIDVPCGAVGFLKE